MRQAILRRIDRLEALQDLGEPVAVKVQVKDGRRPFLVYDGERLKADAWPGHLLVPMAGMRPENEPLPYPLERVPTVGSSSKHDVSRPGSEERVPGFRS